MSEPKNRIAEARAWVAEFAKEAREVASTAKQIARLSVLADAFTRWYTETTANKGVRWDTTANLTLHVAYEYIDPENKPHRVELGPSEVSMPLAVLLQVMLPMVDYLCVAAATIKADMDAGTVDLKRGRGIAEAANHQNPMDWGSPYKTTPKA